MSWPHEIKKSDTMSTQGESIASTDKGVAPKRTGFSWWTASWVSAALVLEIYTSLSRPLPPIMFVNDLPQPRRLKPRVVYLTREAPSKAQHYTVPPMSMSCPYCQVESNRHLWPMEAHFYQECTPMKEWQTTFFPTCNTLHEIGSLVQDVSYSYTDNSNNINDATTNFTAKAELLSLQGSWRSVWGMREQNFDERNVNNNTVAVLKLLKFEMRDYDHESFAYHTTDTLVMERLTASPHVISAYAFCGQSSVTQYAPVSARTAIKSIKGLDRLDFAINLTEALRDLHYVDYVDKPTMAHLDVNIANVVVGDDGNVFLNDFNIAVLLRWNVDQPCGVPVRFERPMWQAPEECRNTSYVDAPRADVYALGNILFHVLTRHQPWTHLEPNGALNRTLVVERKMTGKLPFIPEKITRSSDPINKILLQACLACWRNDPAVRPTSRELHQALVTAKEVLVGNLHDHKLLKRMRWEELFRRS